MIKRIGYSQFGHTRDEIIKGLSQLDGVIIDCRVKPYGLVNLNELRASFKNYMWIKELGNPFLYEDKSRAETYLKLKQIISKETITLIKRLSENSNVYLMCGCKDGDKCHTSLILKILKEAGLDVDYDFKYSNITGNLSLGNFVRG